MGLFGGAGVSPERIEAIERKLDRVLKHLGLDGPEEGGEEVERLLRAGRTIEAIKQYREAHPGLGLKEAKDAVEAIQAGLSRP